MDEISRKRQKLEDYSHDTNKLSKSCDFCKMKKVKCDGLRPLCSFCIKNDLSSCNYSLMKKPGLKPGYGKTMVQRLDNLEEEVKMLKDQLHSVVTSIDSKPIASTASSSDSSSVSASSHSKSSIQIPTLLNPSPTNQYGLPSISQCLLLIDLFFHKISPMFPLLHPSITPELEKSIRNIQRGLEPSLINYAIVLITIKFLNSDQMSDTDKALYYSNCKEKIISTALKKINLENLQSLILLAYDSLGNSVKVPESWNYVSIASDYATYLKLNDEKSIVRLGGLIAGDSPSSINSSTNSNDTIAKRKSKSISNRSLNLLRKPKNWIDEESRRHCFWCIYILDKLYAISSSHEMKLKSNKINCLLPLKLKYWFDLNSQLIINFGQQLRTLRLNSDSPNGSSSSSINRRESADTNTSPLSSSTEDNYDSFTFYIELNKLVGDIHTFLIEEFNINDYHEVATWKMKFKTLENHLFFWMNSLPISFRNFLENGELNDKQLEIYDIIFYVYYYTTLIKLHSAAGFPHGESEYFKSSEDSKKICLDSARKVYNFVTTLVNRTNDEFIIEKLGPLFGFYIWINSRILFVNVVYLQSTNAADALKISLSNYQTMLTFFSDILLRIGRIWESSIVYYKILQFLNVSDLSYVINASPHNQNQNGLDESEENSDDEITGENREPARVFSDMRIGSHSLLFWFNKLAGKPPLRTETPAGIKNVNNGNTLFEAANQLSNFQTANPQSFEEFQLTHDEFFNFLALDINGSGSFQDMR